MITRPEAAVLEPLLEQLGLHQAAAVLPDWLDRAASQELAYADFLHGLLEEESVARANAATQKRLRYRRVEVIYNGCPPCGDGDVADMPRGLVVGTVSLGLRAVTHQVEVGFGEHFLDGKAAAFGEGPIDGDLEFFQIQPDPHRGLLGALAVDAAKGLAKALAGLQVMGGPRRLIVSRRRCVGGSGTIPRIQRDAENHEQDGWERHRAGPRLPDP